MPIQVPAPGETYIGDEIDGVDVARSLLPVGEKGTDLFALKVQGESMIDAMVNDGDIVIMKRTEQASNGEMVAVWLPARDETTLKYFYKEKERYRLQPANPTMGPIYVNKERTPGDQRQSGDGHPECCNHGCFDHLLDILAVIKQTSAVFCGGLHCSFIAVFWDLGSSTGGCFCSSTWIPLRTWVSNCSMACSRFIRDSWA